MMEMVMETLDQHCEAAHIRVAGPHDQGPSVLDQRACRRRKSVKIGLTWNEETIRMMARQLPARWGPAVRAIIWKIGTSRGIRAADREAGNRGDDRQL